MSSTREIRRAFPLKNNYIAVGTETSIPQHDKHLNFTYAYHNINGLEHFFDRFHSETNTVVLPNGYFFYRSTYAFEDSHVKNEMNFCNMFEKNAMVVKESIDPSLAAIIADSDSREWIACVSRDKNEVFLYHPVDDGCVDHYISYSIKGRFPCVKLPQSKLETFKDTESNIEHTGLSIYKLADEAKKIVSIAGLPGLKECGMAVALSSGEIIFGHIKNNEYVQESKLPQPKFYSDKIKLLSTNDSILIAHDPLKNELFIWDFATGLQYAKHACSTMYNLNISTSGKYLTGLEFEGGDVSNTVHCYELFPFKHYSIKLENPIADIAIGHKDQVFLLTKNKDVFKNFNFSGSIQSFFPELKKKQPSPVESSLKQHQILHSK